MLRRLFIITALVGILATAAHAQGPSPSLLLPGVTYERKVAFTLHGPVRMHIVTAPKPVGLYRLAPVLTAGWLQGRAKLTFAQRRLTATAGVVGVNGDLAGTRGGPAGLLIREGTLDSPPSPDRSSLAVDPSGKLVVERVAMDADWRGTGPPRLLKGLNQLPRPGRVTLYTPAWGARTPKSKHTREAVLAAFPAAKPGIGLTGRVVSAGKGGGRRIPSGGAVLSAKASARSRLRAEAKVGTLVTVRLLLSSFSGIGEAVGGGPLLVEHGRAVFDASESFATSWLVPAKPRTAVGQRADGSLLLVAVDGGRPGYSTGLTNFELAKAMVNEGAVTATALSGGASTAMAFDGRLLSRPSTGERSIAEAVLLLYDGVQAPPPSVDVLSPNGDGVGEQQSLAYKLVRRSTVTATLTGPDGSIRTIVPGKPATVGIHRFTWTGVEGGVLQPEGTWTWRVSALDDLARRSGATRDFSLNTTLKSLTVEPAAFTRRGSLQIGLELLHPADLTLQVETRSGVVIRTLRSGQAPVGQVAIKWSGRVRGKVLAPGRYAIRAVAVNEIGRMELLAPFRALRRR